MNKTLAEQSKDRVVSRDELLKQHKSFVSEYFKYLKENKPPGLRKVLREEIEKVELKLIRS